MTEECSKASTAGRLHAFLQNQSGISGMKNGEEATLVFCVTIRIQELRNMVGWNHPWPRMVEWAWIFYLILFSGVDYLLGFYDNDKSKGMGLYIIQSSFHYSSATFIYL